MNKGTHFSTGPTTSSRHSKNNSLISTHLGEQYSKFFEPIDPKYDNWPNVLCNICKLYLVNRSMHDDTSREIPVRFNWPIIRNTRLNTRNSVNTVPVQCAWKVRDLDLEIVLLCKFSTKNLEVLRSTLLKRFLIN